MNKNVKIAGGIGLTLLGIWAAFIRKGSNGKTFAQNLITKSPEKAVGETDPLQGRPNMNANDLTNKVQSIMNSADGKTYVRGAGAEKGGFSVISAKTGDTFNTPRNGSMNKCPAGQHAVSNGNGTYTCVVNNT